MDITWESIFKIIGAGAVSYIFLPLLLVIRDMFVWKVITQFLLSKNLKSSIKQYARLVHKWNTIYTVKAVHNSAGYSLGNDKVSEDEFSEHIKCMDIVSDKINELDLFIKRRSRLIGLLLSHYKHQGVNPIPVWITSECERVTNEQGSTIDITQN